MTTTCDDGQESRTAKSCDPATGCEYAPVPEGQQGVGPANQVCYRGACVRWCAAPGDCPAGHTCLNGVCAHDCGVSTGEPCDACGECICEFTFDQTAVICLGRNVFVGPCASHADCPTGSF